MNLEKLKIADTSLDECLFQLKILADKDFCFIDLIPEFLKEDFHNFLIGHTLTEIDGKSATFDMKAYYNKIINKGFDYPIKWKM